MQRKKPKKTEDKNANLVSQNNQHLSIINQRILELGKNVSKMARDNRVIYTPMLMQLNQTRSGLQNKLKKYESAATANLDLTNHELFQQLTSAITTLMNDLADLEKKAGEVKEEVKHPEKQIKINRYEVAMFKQVQENPDNIYELKNKMNALVNTIQANDTKALDKVFHSFQDKNKDMQAEFITFLKTLSLKYVPETKTHSDRFPFYKAAILVTVVGSLLSCYFQYLKSEYKTINEKKFAINTGLAAATLMVIAIVLALMSLERMEKLSRPPTQKEKNRLSGISRLLSACEEFYNKKHNASSSRWCGRNKQK